MSLVTQLAKGQIDPATFISRASADLAKDAQIFAKLPGVAAIESWAIDMLSKKLIASGLSATLTELIADTLRTALGLPDPTPNS